MSEEKLTASEIEACLKKTLETIKASGDAPDMYITNCNMCGTAWLYPARIPIMSCVMCESRKKLAAEQEGK